VDLPARCITTADSASKSRKFLHGNGSFVEFKLIDDFNAKPRGMESGDIDFWDSARIDAFTTEING